MEATRSAESRRLAALSLEWSKVFNEAARPLNVTQPLDLLTSSIVLISGGIDQPDALDVASVLRPLQSLEPADGLAERCALGWP